MNDKKNSDFPIPDIITIESAKKIFLFCDGNYYKIRESCTDERPLVILWKKSAEENSISKGKLAIVDWDFFFTLLENYHNK